LTIKPQTSALFFLASKNSRLHLNFVKILNFVFVFDEKTGLDNLLSNNANENAKLNNLENYLEKSLLNMEYFFNYGIRF